MFLNLNVCLIFFKQGAITTFFTKQPKLVNGIIAVITRQIDINFTVNFRQDIYLRNLKCLGICTKRLKSYK